MEVTYRDSYWEASGEGAKRPIISEGDTREDAVRGYGEVYQNQLHEADIPLVEVLDELWDFHITTSPKP